MIGRKHHKTFEGIKESDEFLLEELRIYIIEEIITLMEAERIDQAELARRLKASRAYVTKLFNTNINLTLASLNKIAKALGTRVSVRFLPYYSKTAVRNKSKIDHIPVTEDGIKKVKSIKPQIVRT